MKTGMFDRHEASQITAERAWPACPAGLIHRDR